MRRALDIRPTYSYGHYLLGLILLARRDREGALLEMQQETQEDGKRQGLAIVYYALGRKAESDAARRNASKGRRTKRIRDRRRLWIPRPERRSDAWLECAYAQKDPYLYSISRDSLLKHPESDPRYKAFLKKMNLPDGDR
jgi:hypothetical protein